MVVLRDTPGSSTAKQRQMLHRLKRRHGMTDDDLHEAIGAASTTLLSARQASEAIERLSGRGLPNPPGCKPGSYASRRKPPGVTRLITADHVEQIMRMGLDCFGDRDIFLAWLSKDFKVGDPHQLGTAKRAAELIRVLKLMLSRRPLHPSAFIIHVSTGRAGRARRRSSSGASQCG